MKCFYFSTTSVLFFGERVGLGSKSALNRLADGPLRYGSPIFWKLATINRLSRNNIASLAAVEPVSLPVAGLSKRIPILDTLRGFAILLVLQFHFAEGLTNLPVAQNAVYGVLHAGWIGVDLFFVLSGFLITGILLDSRKSARYFRNFYMRRLLRTFPLYYGFLFGVLIVIPLIRPIHTEAARVLIHNQIWLWLYATNIALVAKPDTMTPLSHFWSLAVEEQFYLVWPFVVYYLPVSKLIRVCGMCFAFSLIARCILMASGIGHPAAYVLTPCRLDALSTGAYIAVIWREGWLTRSKFYLALVVLLLSFIFLAVVFIKDGLRLEINAPFMQSVGYSAVDLFFGSILVVAIYVKKIQALDIPVLAQFGKYSYAIYIFHRPLHGWLYKVVGLQSLTTAWAPGLPRLVPFLVLAPVACLLLSAVSWNLYERHFLQAKRFFR